MSSRYHPPTNIFRINTLSQADNYGIIVINHHRQQRNMARIVGIGKLDFEDGITKDIFYIALCWRKASRRNGFGSTALRSGRRKC